MVEAVVACTDRRREDTCMAWTETDIPDLSGRTAVVTGANGGLGLQTALGARLSRSA